MKKLAIVATGLMLSTGSHAVTPAKDVAATINLNGYACGNTASDIKETTDSNGNKVITAKCANGKRYRITVSNKGRVSVQPL